MRLMTQAFFQQARMAALLASTTLLAAGLSGQATWVVPDYLDVAPYFAQAAPGDIVQLGVRHPTFTLTKGLTVLGRVGGTIIIDSASSPVLQHSSLIAIPAGQEAHICRLNFRPTSTLAGLRGQQVSVTGSASFEDCSFLAYDGTQALLANGLVSLQRCDLETGIDLGAGGAEALRVTGGVCTVSQCSLQGSPSDFGIGYYSKPGANVVGGTLIISNSVVVGGAADMGPNFFASPGIVCGAGTCYVTVSTVQGGPGAAGVLPAPAIAVTSGVSIARTILQSSVPSTGVTVDPDLVGMSATQPLQLGQTFVATATAGSSQQALVIFGGYDRVLNALPPIVEPVLIDPVGIVALTLAVPSPGAQVQQALSVPNVPALRGRTVWLQALQFAGSSLHVSTVVGGLIR